MTFPKIKIHRSWRLLCWILVLAAPRLDSGFQATPGLDPDARALRLKSILPKECRHWRTDPEPRVRELRLPATPGSSSGAVAAPGQDSSFLATREMDSGAMVPRLAGGVCTGFWNMTFPGHEFLVTWRLLGWIIAPWQFTWTLASKPPGIDSGALALRLSGGVCTGF